MWEELKRRLASGEITVNGSAMEFMARPHGPSDTGDVLVMMFDEAAEIPENWISPFSTETPIFIGWDIAERPRLPEPIEIEADNARPAFERKPSHKLTPLERAQQSRMARGFRR